MGKKRIPWPTNYYSTLRKEANFGCAVCGKPWLLQIHHIEGYVDGVVEKLERLIMLCIEHHDIADSGKIKKEELYGLKKNPCNLNKVNHSFAIPTEKELTIYLGGNTIIECPIILEIKNESIISMKREKDQLLLSANFYDKNDELKLKIIDNAWEGDVGVEDIRYSEKQSDTEVWLSIKMEKSEPNIDVKIIDGAVHVTGKFYRGGQLFEVRPEGIFVNNNQAFITGSTFSHCGGAISIG